jgi:oligopeptide transport system substrate-binding protein
MGTRANLYDAGEVDRILVASEFVDKYKRNEEEFSLAPDVSTFFLRMNQKRDGKDTLLANKNARLAIAMGFDKEGLTNVLLNDGSIPAGYVVPKGFVKGANDKDFRDTYGDILKTDVEKAKKYWEQVKQELGTDQITVELLSFDTDTSKKIGEYLKDQLEKNLPGLTVNIKQQPFKQKLDLEAQQDYEISFSGWGPDYPDPMTFLDMFETGNAHNGMGYSNAEYDTIIRDSKSTLLTNPKERLDQLAKAEKILLNDAAVAPIFQSSRAVVQRLYVKDIATHTFGGEYTYKWAYIEEHE